MEHSQHFEEVRVYYQGGTYNGCKFQAGTWKIGRIFNAVGKWISKEEYYEITGINYPYKSLEEENAANTEV